MHLRAAPHAPLLSNSCTCSWQTFAHERAQHLLDHYQTMLDRTTKTGPEKPSPQKLKTKGTIHLLTFLAAFRLLESVGAADTAAGTTHA